MRQLVRFDSREEAETLGDALYADGIDNDVDRARDGAFQVWVHDETQLGRARDILELFEDAPDDPRFAEARRIAETKRKDEAREEKKSRHETVDVRTRWRRRSGPARLTIGLIVGSVIVAVLSRLGDDDGFISQLTYASYELSGGYVRWHGIEDILSGEAWRIVTPIFVHYGAIHLIFNMYMLWVFGGRVELVQGSLFLLAMVLVVAVTSNTGQYFIGGSPTFGGMSGVIYALFGYMWIRGRYDPGSGYAVHRSTVIILLVWFVLGLTGMMNMANTAHGVGLLVGVVWGLLASGQIKRWLRR